jgi:hypothetical protein
MVHFTPDLPTIAFKPRPLVLTIPYTRGTHVSFFQRLYNTMLEIMAPPKRPMGWHLHIDGIFSPETKLAATNVQTYFGAQSGGCSPSPRTA